MKTSLLSTLILLSGLAFHAQSQIITTIAGGGTANPGDGGPALDCVLGHPAGIVKDASGNIYFCERDTHRVRKVDPSGVITTIAGTGVAGNSGDGGPATNAMLKGPYAIAIDASGNILVGDANTVVRKINTSGIISTIAGTGIPGYSGDGGNATAAQLNGPGGIALDLTGNIYLADNFNYRIRKIDAGGIITTVVGTGVPGSAGDGGPATAAELGEPSGVCFDGSGNMFIADTYYDRVRKVSPSGIISTIAGTSWGFSGDGGPATSAKINNPIGIAADKDGNILFSDTFNGRVRKISSAGIISTIAGTGNPSGGGDGGPATDASLANPVGVFVDNSGDIYICDMSHDRVKVIRNTVSAAVVDGVEPIVLSIYPNPSNAIFALEIKAPTIEMVSIVITNISGQIVKHATIRANYPEAMSLNVPSGLYIVTASTSLGNFSQKLTVTY